MCWVDRHGEQAGQPTLRRSAAARADRTGIGVQASVGSCRRAHGQLDHTTTGLVLDAIRAVLDQGTTVVIVTHDQYVAAQCECSVTLEDGGIKDDTGEEADHGQA